MITRVPQPALGTATAQTNVTWTANTAGLSLNAAGYAGTNTTFNGTNASASITQNSQGIRLDLSVPAGNTGLLSAGGQTASLGTVVFFNSNGVSFGVNGQTVTASHNALTSQSNQAFSAQGGSSAFQTLGFSNQNGMTFTNTNGSVGVTHDLQYTSNTSAITSNALHSSASRVLNVVAATDNAGGGTASLSSNVSFSNANGATFYTSAGNAVALSYTVPSTAGLLSAINVSAGTTNTNASNFALSNANGVSFGLDGRTITASVATSYRASNDAVGLNTALTAGPLAWTVNSSGISLNAGGAAGTSSGFAGGSISGSITHNTAGINISLSHPVWLTTAMASNAVTLSNMRVSAGTTSNLLSALTFADSNGISFGLNASTLTASHNGLTTAAQSDHSHGNPTLALTNLFGTTASNSAGFTLSLSASAGGGNTGFLSAGANTASLGTVVFSNSNGLSFGLDGQTLTASHNALTTARASNDAIGLNTAQTNVTWTVNSAGLSLNAGGYAGTGYTSTTTGGTAIVGTLNTAGLSLGVPAFLTTAAAQSNQTGGVYALGNTTGQSSSSTYDLRTLSVDGGGIVSVGWSNSTLRVSATQSNQAFSADASSTFQTLSFQDSNGVSFSNNAGALRVTHALQYTSNTSAITSNALHSSASRVFNVVAATNNTGGGTASLSSNVSFSNANGATFYTSAGNAVVLSYTVPSTAGLLSVINVSAGTTSTNASNFTFANANGVSFGLDGRTITASHNALTTARASNDAIGLNTAQSNVTWTVNSSGLSLDARGYAGTGTSNTGAASFTLNSNGLQFNGSSLAGVGTTFNGTNVSGSMTMNTAGLRLDLSANVGGGGGAAISAGANSQSTGTVNFANSNGITFGLSNNGTMTASYDSTRFAGTNTTFAGANISASMTLNSNGLNLSASVAAPGAVAENNWVHFLGANTSGNTTVSGSTLGLSGINLTLSGTNDSRLAISAPATSSLSATGALAISTNANTISIGVGPMSAYAVGNTVNSSSGTWDARSLSFAGSGNVSVGVSNGSVLVYGDNAAVKSYFRFLENWAGMVTGASAITQTSGSSVFVQPFWLPYPVSASYLRMLASFNDKAAGTGGTTSANTTFSVERYTTIAAVVYTQGVGLNSLSLRSIYSTSAGITGRTIYSAGAQGSQYTMTLQKTYPATGASGNQYTTSYAVSSGSIVLSSQSNTLFTGPRFLDIPFGTSLGVGPYWLGIGASTSSASNSSNISAFGTATMGISLAGVSQSNVSVGILGAVTSASDHQLARGLGVFTTNASIISTNSIGIGQISQMASNRQLIFELIREA